MRKSVDVTGWVMKEHGIPDSKITIIKEIEPRITTSGRKDFRCLCKCECGKEFITSKGKAKRGITKSCGCLQRERLAIRNANNSSVKVGNRYGKLVIIKDLGMRKQKSRDKNERWSLCKCDCGNEIEVPNNMLQTGWKQSCGCLSSKGELKIEQLLKENNINFAKEYSFNELRGINGGLLRFDFVIFNIENKISYLIEFDGRQHEKGYDTEYWKHYSNEEIKEHDKRKNDFCKNNNYLLKRIPYSELKNLTYEAIISEKYNV